MREEVVKMLVKESKLKKEEIENILEIPPNQEFGDYAFPCFILSKKLKKNPAEVSNELAKKIKPQKEIDKIEAKGPYLNFFINKKILAESTIKKILIKKLTNEKLKLKGMIEFSQANTHKAFHVGHIRGTSLGESLSRIAEFFGEKVIRVNYQGDTGMHVAKWLWNYTKNHLKEKLKSDESWIAGIYVDAVKRLEEDKTGKFQEEVNEINRRLEGGKDKKLNALWKKTRKLSLDSLEGVYKELGTKFDRYYFESEMEKQGKELSLELLKKGIAKKSEGAVIINLEKYNLGVWVLLRKDNTVLYSAKDLALAEKKFKDYKLDWSLYVHGSEQNLHFNQIIKTLELMKFKNLKKIHHVNFDLVRLPSGKMSSRTGGNIPYSEFVQEVKNHAKKEIKKRFPKISKKEIEARALKISIAAIKYSFLKQDPNKTIVFDKEEALNFEGDTGPYIQYSYARAGSVLKKSKKKPVIKITDLTNSEIELVKKLGKFENVVKSAYEKFNPALISNYSFELSQKFNEFYHKEKVIGSEFESSRLAIVESFRIIIKKSLYLLGIDVLEEM